MDYLVPHHDRIADTTFSPYALADSLEENTPHILEGVKAEHAVLARAETQQAGDLESKLRLRLALHGLEIATLRHMSLLGVSAQRIGDVLVEDVRDRVEEVLESRTSALTVDQMRLLVRKVTEHLLDDASWDAACRFVTELDRTTQQALMTDEEQLLPQDLRQDYESEVEQVHNDEAEPKELLKQLFQGKIPMELAPVMMSVDRYIRDRIFKMYETDAS